MKTRSLAVAAARAAAHVRILLLCLSLLPGASATAPAAGAAAAGNLSVSGAWGRATTPGVTVGGAYFTIVNRGNQPDTLFSLSSPVAAAAALHRTTVENGVSTMRPAGPLVIAPGQTVKVEPGGLHVMLMTLKGPLVAGTSVPLVLNFQRAGAITVQIEVQPLVAAAHDSHKGTTK